MLILPGVFLEILAAVVGGAVVSYFVGYMDGKNQAKKDKAAKAGGKA